MNTLTGGCLCGAVRYTADDCFEYAMNCHCSQCRRATGSAFKAFAGIPLGHLSLVPGAGQQLIYGNATAEHDIHCGTCGSLLYSVVRGGAYAHVALGTLIDAPSIRPSMHIFVGSKANWYEITDNLPQHEGLPPE